MCQGDSNEYPQRFYGELTKIILELSSNILLICSTDNLIDTYCNDPKFSDR